MDSKNSFLLGTSFLMGAGAVTAQQVKKPHIILIMTDQQPGDCFDKGYSTTPSRTPAPTALLTDLSPWHHGRMGYGVVAERYRYEMPRLLRETGYYTFGIGKMHWFPQKTLHGFHGTLPVVVEVAAVKT